MIRSPATPKPCWPWPSGNCCWLPAWGGGWVAAGLVTLSTLFFTLANWGTSDITRFSHYLAISPGEVLDEPLWIAAAPLISALPYRLASLHGLVAGGYALVPLMLSRATPVSYTHLTLPTIVSV